MKILSLNDDFNQTNLNNGESITSENKKAANIDQEKRVLNNNSNSSITLNESILDESNLNSDESINSNDESNNLIILENNNINNKKLINRMNQNHVNTNNYYSYYNRPDRI